MSQLVTLIFIVFLLTLPGKMHAETDLTAEAETTRQTKNNAPVVSRFETLNSEEIQAMGDEYAFGAYLLRYRSSNNIDDFRSMLECKARLAEIYRKQTLTLYRGGKLAEFIQQLDEQTKQQGVVATALAQLHLSLACQKAAEDRIELLEMQEGIVYLQAALDALPENDDASFALGELYCRLKKNREALPLLEAAIEGGRAPLNRLLTLSQLYFERKQLMDGLTVFEGACERFGEDNEASMKLDAFARKNRQDIAEAYRQRGWMQLELGDKEAALVSYDQGNALVEETSLQTERDMRFYQALGDQARYAQAEARLKDFQKHPTKSRAVTWSVNKVPESERFGLANRIMDQLCAENTKVKAGVSATNRKSVASSIGRSKGKKTLIRFTASWCGPCKKVEKEMVKSEVRDALKYYNYKVVDIDRDKQTARKYNITGVPAFVIVDSSGKELKRIVGGCTAKKLAAWLDSD